MPRGECLSFSQRICLRFIDFSFRKLPVLLGQGGCAPVFIDDRSSNSRTRDGLPAPLDFVFDFHARPSQLSEPTEDHKLVVHESGFEIIDLQMNDDRPTLDLIKFFET